jgi:SCY1-like protein 1
MPIVSLYTDRMLMVDRLVRDQANKTLDIYVARVRKYAETLPATVHAAAQVPGSAGGPVQMATGNAADPGWTGWAISSFASKFAASNGDIEPTANVPISSSGTPDPSRPSTATSGTASLAQSNVIQKPATVRQTTETTRIAQSFAAPPAADEAGWDQSLNEVEGGDDAWGTMDDEDDMFFDASAKATSTTNTAKPIATSAQNGEPDFASWLAAKQATTVVKKGPLPKGLGAAAKPVTRSAPATRPASTNLPSRIVPAVNRVAAKPVVKAPTLAAKKAVEEDEAWGDAWD